MNTFYVVVRFHDTGIFTNLTYKTKSDVLTETDLLEIERYHADKGNGVNEIKTQIISWQLIK